MNPASSHPITTAGAAVAITGRARIAGVIGWPVDHSLSPVLHGWWLHHYGIDGAYVPLAVRPPDLSAALAALPKLGFAGANVTVPHKQAAAACVDALTPTAQRLGAINTIIIDAHGRRLGDSTDGFGFLENLREGAGHWRADRGPVVVIGAGGAARAIVAALADAGVPEIRLFNRTRERADRLAADLGGPIICRRWEERHAALATASLLINTTTQGMTGQPPLDLDLETLPTEAVVSDLVYVPLLTPLLATAQRRGNAIVDGLGMLLHQARAGFRAWFGIEPQVTAAQRAFLLAALSQHQR
ncbi:MAG: shikimate dehydrogenase [Rhodospirillales bacterium]|jgi:shikimate dehydrogenase|nr:shikimate dehydrogenase [Rhodospirillales bacterium]